MDELWKPITGYEGLYEVSNLGRVRSLDRMVRNNVRGGIRLLKGQILKLLKWKGYLYVNLWREDQMRRKSIHRLVAEHFLPHRRNEESEINHLDLNPENNIAANLEWCTRSQNQQHAIGFGRCHAMTNPRKRKKLSPEIVAKIRETRKASGLSYAIIGKRFSISGSMVEFIVKGKQWPI